ncbi:MAG: hypothetical protein RLZZ161_770 [Bacteroidota bacterium]|jgi:7-carboxy-7-deazaguanine synthase
MEQFYTIQGEGYYAGTAAYFIRLAGCDVGCVWCDVKESWDAGAHPVLQVSELADAAAASGALCCVITGGEPAMYDLTELSAALREKGLRVHIETSAAHPVRGHFDWVCISPKKFKFPLEEELKNAGELKIVVFNKSDFEWAEMWIDKVNEECVCLLQPEWDKREHVIPLIVDYVKLNPRWKISLQTHKYLGVP